MGPKWWLQLDARSEAWLSFWIAFRFSLPVVPTAVISRHIDCEQDPLTPTLAGNSQVRHPRCLQRSRSSMYFACFLSYASSHCVSHGTVSSIMVILPVLDHRTISGLKVVWTMSGKTSLLPRSTYMFHPVVPSKLNASASCGVALVIVSPGFTKAMWCFGLLPSSFFLSFSSQSANSL